MSDLLWPGDERAGTLFDARSMLEGMVALEAAWSAALTTRGLAPREAAVRADELNGLVTDGDLGAIALAAEGGGNPVIPLLHVLRARLEAADRPEAALWLHRGLTSQDVVDTAVVLCCATALRRLEIEFSSQVDALTALADAHRGTLMVGRTLTQHAVPTTFGAKAAGWLAGVVDARATAVFAHSVLPVQLGGAAGTLAGTVELARLRGAKDPVGTTVALTEEVAAALGLQASPPWHASRFPLTRVGDALVTATSAFGHIASDVVTLTRPEVREVAEPSAPGRGGSSTMPQKQNPVLSVLVRRAVITNPGLAATLHTAAGLANDERPDGAWHAEWATLRDLARRTVVAAAHTTELVRGLRVDAAGMVARARAADGLLAERDSVRALVGEPAPAPATPETPETADDPASYLGIIDPIVDRRITP